MRVSTRTEVAPAEEYTVTTYGCDECDFTFSDEQDIDTHYAKTHARKAKLNVDGRELYRFTSESDAKAWLDQTQYDVRHLPWQGPGWYATETWSQPCPHGCCTDSCISLVSASSWVTESIGRAREIMDEVRAVRAAIRGAEHG